MYENLPEYPEDNEIYTDPEGHPLGSSSILTLKYDNKIIGSAQSLIRVTNSSKKFVLQRVITAIPIEQEINLDFTLVQRNITSVIFKESYGWHPHTYGESTVQIAKKLRVLNYSYLSFSSSVLFIYETINTEEIKEDP